MPPDTADTVEDSYYDHTEYGRVRVGFIVESETTVVAGERIPRGVVEDATDFVAATEPADLTVGLPPAESETAVPTPGV